MAAADKSAVNIMHGNVQEVKHTMKAARLLYSAPPYILRGPIYLVFIITVSTAVYSWFGKKETIVTCPLELTQDATDVQSPEDGEITQIYVSVGSKINAFSSLVDIQYQFRATGGSEAEKLRDQLEKLERDKRFVESGGRDLDKRLEDLKRESKSLENSEKELDVRIQKEKNDYKARVEDAGRAVGTIKLLFDQMQTNTTDAENNVKNRLEALNKAKDRHKENQDLFAKKMITRLELDASKDTLDNTQEAYDNSRTALNRAQGEVKKVQLQLQEAEGAPARLKNEEESRDYGRNQERSNIKSRISELTFEIERTQKQKVRTADDLNRDIEETKKSMELSSSLLPNVKYEGKICKVSSKFGGKVTHVFIKPGDRISSGSVMFRVIRDTEAMYARVLVQNWEIGSIKQNDRVKLKYFTYPYQEFGVMEGMISKIPDTPSLVKGQESMYEVRVALQEMEREREGRIVKVPAGKILAGSKLKELNVGLQGLADIKTGEKKLIELIFTPISKWLHQDE